jgi:bifunctional NMN adenylyltransferase/nudix hydrolase
MTPEPEVRTFRPVDPAERPVRRRRTARVLVVDHTGRMLLFSDSDPGIPGLRWWITPGGGVDPGESDLQAAVRELAEETNLELLEATLRGCLREVAVFDDPNRSLRGRTITHVHCFDLGERELPEVVGGDDAASARWVPIAALAAMEDSFHDDHFHILDHILGLTAGPASSPIDDAQ